MKISISNLLLILLALSLAFGWYADRSLLHRNYERESSIVHAVDRVQESSRIWASHYGIDQSKDQELRDIIRHRDDGAERFLNLMSIYDSRDLVSDPLVAKVFTQMSMEQLGCKDITELRQLLLNSKWDFRIALEDGTEESAHFERYLEKAMRPIGF